MSYSFSQTDRDNSNWFANDRTRNTLTKIKIENGNIRGIFPCEVNFRYPISALAGENGSGKSTLLALSVCAFHNDDGFHQYGRSKSYFTFGDFFTFAPTETGIGEIRISYGIRKVDGETTEIRRKKPSGKWNDFNTRTKRNCIYLGINRIVPPSESSPHKSYRRQFQQYRISEGIRRQIIEIAGRIFEKNYTNLEIFSHNNYRLYLVRRDELNYSGFNMGAGENAVFSILYELLSAGTGALLVIDEIELGLHARAQDKFIEELKLICNRNKCQIICSTHSDIILDALPPEGRFFIESKLNSTIITPEITSLYAFGKLMGQCAEELDVFVEDEVGLAFLMNILPIELRERVKIYPIGSDQAVLRQMAARYREGKRNFMSFLDGDKHLNQNTEIAQISTYLENRIEDRADFEAMMRSRLCYLPGDNWPERHIVEQILLSEDFSRLVERWGAGADDVRTFLEQSLAAGKHREFFSLSNKVYSTEDAVRNDCIQCYKNHYRENCDAISRNMNNILGQL